MKIAIVAITEQGLKQAEYIKRVFSQADKIPVKNGIRTTLEYVWERYEAIICIMASGIVIRCLAGLVKNKHRDPCVVVVDEKCRYVVSLLSGHLGGGNELARRIAKHCNAQAVITTGSDVSGHTAVDLWTVENNLAIVNYSKLTEVSALLLRQGHLKIFQEEKYIPVLPDDFKFSEDKESAEVVITLNPNENARSLQLVPRICYIGLGCRAGASEEEFIEAMNDLKKEEGLDLRSVAGIASIDIKKEEKGLLQFASNMKWQVRFFSKERINKVVGIEKSQKVHDKIGVYGVSEPAAVLAASDKGIPGRIIVGKKKWKRITAAVAIPENFGL